MKSIVANLVQYGDLRLKVFDCDPDEGLPMHSHVPGDEHISVVTNGSFRVHGEGWELVAQPGDVLDFEPGQPHEIEALEPGSRIVNIAKVMRS